MSTWNPKPRGKLTWPKSLYLWCHYFGCILTLWHHQAPFGANLICLLFLKCPTFFNQLCPWPSYFFDSNEKKEDFRETVITYLEDGIYDEAVCDCDNCSQGLEHQGQTPILQNRDSVYFYELDGMQNSWHYYLNIILKFNYLMAKIDLVKILSLSFWVG